MSLNPVSRLLGEKKRPFWFILAHIFRKSAVNLGNHPSVMSQKAQYLSHNQVLLRSAEHVYVGLRLIIYMYMHVYDNSVQFHWRLVENTMVKLAFSNSFHIWADYGKLWLLLPGKQRATITENITVNQSQQETAPVPSHLCKVAPYWHQPFT